MKAKYAILLIALGYCFDFVAAWLKLTHAPYAGNLLFVGIGFKIVGIALLAFKIMGYEGFKKFMNS